MYLAYNLTLKLLKRFSAMHLSPNIVINNFHLFLHCDWFYIKYSISPLYLNRN